MTQKKNLLTAFAILLFAGVSFAQETRPAPQRQQLTPQERADKQTEHLTKRLQLTDVQQEQVHQVLLGQATEMEQLRSGWQEDRQQKRAEAKAIQDRSMESMGEILNETQLEELKVLQEERKAKMKEKRKALR